MSGWRRVLLLVLVVLAALAGTRADVCLCGADRPAAPEAAGRACCAPPAVVEACCCCAPPAARAIGALAALPPDRATVSRPACGCPGLDLSGLASEAAVAGPSLADAWQRSHVAHAIDLPPARALDAGRVLAFASRAGPTTRPPPGARAGHVVLRC